MPLLTAVQKKAEKFPKVTTSAGLKQFMNARNTAYAGAFFFLTLMQWFGMPASFCVSCALALCVTGENMYAPACGIALGCVCLMLWGVETPWWNLIAVCGLMTLQGYKWRNIWGVIGTCIGILLPGMLIYGIVRAYTVQEWILGSVMIILSGGMMPALKKAALFIRNPRNERMSQDDVLCMLIPVMMLLSGMGKVAVFDLNIGYAAAVAIVLVTARCVPLFTAMAIGMSFGIGFMVSGCGVYWSVTLPLIGASGVLMQGKRKWCISCLGVLVSAATAYLMKAVRIHPPLICTCVGCIAWILTPNRYQREISKLAHRTGLIKKQDDPYLESKMLQLTEYLGRLSSAVPKPTLQEQGTEQLAESLMENLCENCDRLLICWRDCFQERKEQFIALADEIRLNGRCDRAPDDCIKEKELLSLMESVLEKRQAFLRRTQQVEYEQEMMKTHFSAISKIVRQHIEAGARAGEEEYYEEKQIEEMLAMLHVPADVQYVKRENGHYVTEVKMHPFSKCCNIEALEMHISRQLGKRMHLSVQAHDRMLFEELPPLQIAVGTASTCAVSTERKNITPYVVENGDAVLQRKVRCGVEMVALSDGMGHGTGAGYESRKTLELMSILLEAGYSSHEAIKAVNGMMLSASGGDRFATVDMCMIDLWTGNLSLHKLGANRSLIIQGQNIVEVEGEALPLGIIEHVVPNEHHASLGDGDTVLLFSDGVTDAFEDEHALPTLIHRYNHLSPQMISDSLLQDALIQSGGLPKDDMTVICIRLFKRPKRQK